MNLARPHAIITRGVDGDVLRVLSSTHDEMTGRQVHRMVGRGSNRTVQLALDRLAREGLVDVREHGPSKLYSFNVDHLAAGPVLELIGLRTRLVDRLRAALEEWRPAPAYAALFGSAARGEGDSDSDIDLFVVRPDGVGAEDERWRAQIAALERELARWTGNHAGISELSIREARRLLAEGPPILDELRNDAISLKGPRFETWIQRLA